MPDLIVLSVCFFSLSHNLRAWPTLPFLFLHTLSRRPLPHVQLRRLPYFCSRKPPEKRMPNRRPLSSHEGRPTTPMTPMTPMTPTVVKDDMNFQELCETFKNYCKCRIISNSIAGSLIPPPLVTYPIYVNVSCFTDNS